MKPNSSSKKPSKPRNACPDDGPSQADKADKAEEALAKAPQQKRAESSPDTIFPIVAIGASAGGLGAIESFFSAMPANTSPGLAFVIVQHLSPDHKSILTDLVKRYTAMGVVEVTDGVHVHANCVYIIPPNRDMTFINGRLHLHEPIAPRGQRLPIDFFFRSLAQDQLDAAICIVLSGTGSDGTLGLRAIKGEGGMAMVQSPESAEYDGMPRSAIATGLVDYVCNPSEMPAKLLSFIAHAPFKQGPALPHPAGVENAMDKIHSVLRIHTGHDFSHYKRNTIERRIQRRMAVHQIANLGDYLQFLQKSPAETHALFQELLIGVTSFFRDPQTFEALAKDAIPALFKGKHVGAPIRVWVPGCSTGEEAYSLAILLQEEMTVLKRVFKVQIFATDLDSRAIETARAGIYPASITADVSQERLSRFFSQEPGAAAYRIQKSIRDMLVFSEQDIIKDPPFSKVDLISCRNLLIYMDSDLQRKIIPLFHYALNSGGFLFLGTSEGIGDFCDLFSTVHRKEKIFRRKDYMTAPGARRLPPFVTPPSESAHHRASIEKVRETKVSLRELVEAMLLRQFAPVAALVNSKGDILYLHGRTGYYLEPAPGEAGMNILKMAREGLRRPLSTALHKTVMQGEPVCCAGVRVRTNGDFTTINLTVQPASLLEEPESDSAVYLVILEKAPERIEAHPAPAKESREGGKDLEMSVDARIAALEQELRAKEEYIRSTKEELETSNEELKSSNEEMQSVNEELQSTNEELETAKEEAQSVNEELATVNAELQAKVADLSQANNDMNNLLAGTGLGTIFVDHQQKIQRFTPAVTEVISLIATDVGRPLGQIVSNLVNYDRLAEDIQTVLDTLVPKEIEAQTKAGAWYLLGIRPYRTLENVIEGAVITFVNITELKKSQMMIQRTEGARHVGELLSGSRDAMVIFGLDGRILAWSPSATLMYGWSEEEALQRNIRDLLPEENREECLEKIRKIALSNTWDRARIQRRHQGGQTLQVAMVASPLLNSDGDLYAIATIERFASDRQGA